jgi:D-aminopeptidase
MTHTRARDLGIPLEGTPGAFNAITDVDGVLVGQTTLIAGDGKLHVGKGPVRTGVTMIMPRGKTFDPCFAGWYSLNGNGEMTGTTWLEESGFLESPIGITNTHSVGTVRDAIIAWEHRNKLYSSLTPEYDDDESPPIFWSLPVVAETYDGGLNDINGQHVKAEHVFSALDHAASGIVAEGCVGGGTGMICHEFKGGIGTASRKTTQGYTVGVLVQANYGLRSQLTIAGVPVGREITDLMPERRPHSETGSIIVVVATDAPLLPHQLKRLARRVPLGIGRLGGMGGNSSGDIFIAFSTANAGVAARSGLQTVSMLPNDEINPLFAATVQATEEAILNAMVAAQTMTGINGYTVHALPHDRVREALKKYNRLQEN